MKLTDLLLAAILFIVATVAFNFIEHMFRKTSESSNCAAKYIRIIEISNAIGKNRHSD